MARGDDKVVEGAEGKGEKETVTHG